VELAYIAPENAPRAGRRRKAGQSFRPVLCLAQNEHSGKPVNLIRGEKLVMKFLTLSQKRESHIDLGRFRAPIFVHKALLYVQRAGCHEDLKSSSIHLMALGALWLDTHGTLNVQVVNKGEQMGGIGQ
jgi:hypothetical protein